MDATKQARGRGGPQWVMTGLMLVLALGMFVGAAAVWLQEEQLSSHGVRATALVQARHPFGRGYSYLIAFDTSDNRPITEWSDGIPDSTRVGDRVHIAYEASDPAIVQDIGTVHRGPWAAVLIGAFGFFFLWMARRTFRMDPEARGWGRKPPR